MSGEFALDNWIWGAPQWLIPAAVIAAVLALLVLWNYLSGRSIGRLGLLAAGLKLCAVGLIAICLLEPLRSGTRPRPQANVLPILVDNSQSMQLKPSEQSPSRGERVLKHLDSDAAWLTRLSQDFDVRPYLFDTRLNNVAELSAAMFDGTASSLTGSLQSLAERFEGRPVGGVLLFTDGNLTDAAETGTDWSSLGFPVYPVLQESPDGIRDLHIADVSVRQTDFESAPVTLSVSVGGMGISESDVVVQLLDASDQTPVEEQTVRLSGDAGTESARFRFRPKRSGTQFYQARVFLEAERAKFEQGDSGTEATLANNSRLIAVNRAQGPYRVLYIAGRPNWEFKFLRRALQADAEVQLVGLLRIAKEEPKFGFRDRGVSETNPLFAGLGDSEEETAEQYDEPVLIRLGVRESEELSEGFPESAEELFGYHAVILDDIGPDFFSQDQLLLLRRFVAARGGGLLMLGGLESFAGKAFADSPLGELSPVYTARSSVEARAGAYRLGLTREGILQPWVRLRDNESAETGRLNSMPPFTTLSPVGEVKPGSSTLATVVDEQGQPLPALVAQRFGKGRSAALPVGDLWRWSMRRGLADGESDPGGPAGDPGSDPDGGERDDPGQAWRQITHWLVNDVPRRAEVRLKADDDPSKPTQIFITARDEAYLPLDNATINLTVTPLSGEPFELVAQPDESEPGLYIASYWSKTAGGFSARAKIVAPDGSSVGTATAGWASDPAASEFQQLRLNRELLASIAQQTGGEVVSEDGLDEFAADLPNRKLPVTETWVYPIWHRIWVMGVAMLCLCSEWGLRRWRGLP